MYVLTCVVSWRWGVFGADRDNSLPHLHAGIIVRSEDIAANSPSFSRHGLHSVAYHCATHKTWIGCAASVVAYRDSRISDPPPPQAKPQQQRQPEHQDEAEPEQCHECVCEQPHARILRGEDSSAQIPAVKATGAGAKFRTACACDVLFLVSALVNCADISK